MEQKLTYLGITFDKENLKSFEECGFTKEEYGDDIFFVSPQMQHCEDCGIFDKMKYRFVITCECDTGAMVKNENGEEVDGDFYMAYIIPDMELIHDSKFKELQEFYGWDDKSLAEVKAAMTYYDLVREYGMCFGSELVPSDGEWKYSIVDGMATALQTINSLLGFYLDKQYNWCMNGWDCLELAMTDKDIIYYSKRNEE
jgi:acetone carboxylase gamma subunit